MQPTYNKSGAQVRQVSYAYGLEGESLSVTGGTEPVAHQYDAAYRIKTLTDGNNRAITYSYNAVGYPASITYPGGDTVQFPSYDASGNLLQRIDGRGVVTNYVYNDPAGALTDVQYPATPALNVSLSYDTYGRRSGLSDGTGSATYAYGDLDELTSVTTTYTGLPAQTLSYSYHADGSRAIMTTPAGAFSYLYDGLGRPVSITNPLGETTSWTYIANDWLWTQQLGNGARTTYTYNALGQATQLTSRDSGNALLSEFGNITHDGAGNRTTITATVPAVPALGGTTSYSYDHKDQLTQEQSTRNGGYTNGFAYDAAGNSTSFIGQTRTYNLNNQQTGSGFVYNGNGNPTTYNGVSPAFDPENKLTSVGGTLTACYTAGGVRAWKQTGAGRTYFLYDGVTPVVELNASGTVTAVNTFGAAGLVSRTVTGTSSVFYTFDAQGSVAQRLDASGTVLSSHLFSAHGSQISVPATADPFGYKGQWGYNTGSETGLILCTFRYYDPGTGRFLTRDPIGYEGGINLYGYVANNAVNAADPEGLAPSDDSDIVDNLQKKRNDQRQGVSGLGDAIASAFAWLASLNPFASAHEAATGKNAFGDKVSRSDQWWAALGGLPGGKGAKIACSAEQFRVARAWSKGGFNTLGDSLMHHFRKHGDEVGAKDLWQYLRKAYEFGRNLKGAGSPVAGATPNVRRWYKDGKYIDRVGGPTGKIISFGKQ